MIDDNKLATYTYNPKDVLAIYVKNEISNYTKLSSTEN